MWLNTFQAERRSKRGRRIYFYEPLQTNAPIENCQPYCCYLRTIVFYKQPYIADASGNYERWDEIETKWDLLGQRWTEEDWGWASLAPLVLFEEKIYELGGGEVILIEGRWYMRWLGWRVTPHDHRWPWILARSLEEYPPTRGNNEH